LKHKKTNYDMVRDFWDTLHMQQFFFHVKEVSVSEHQNCF